MAIFFWSLLTGSNKSKFFGTMEYNQIVSGEEIWRLLPISIRRWWIDAVHEEIVYSGPIYPYSACTMEYPAPYFIDRTTELSQFNENLILANGVI